MSKNIELVKIESAEQDIAVLSAAVMEPDSESLDTIKRKTTSGFYAHAKLAQFGDFMIMLDGKLVGQISLNTSKDSNFASNKIVNIEFSYGLLKQDMGKGLMTEVLRLAIRQIQAAKDAHQDIIFVEYDGYSPEKHTLLTAQKIGEVCANVMGISNYPSLSCCIKAGGKVTELQSYSIHLTFLNQGPASHFSEASISALMKYSKTLCQLGFDDSYRHNPPDAAEKSQASEASKTFAWQIEDTMAQVAILCFMKQHAPGFVQDWIQDASMKQILGKIKAAGCSHYAPEFFVDESAKHHVASDLSSNPEVFSASAGSVEGSNMPLIAEHATPDADVLV
jgi:hypothetical protein